MVGVEPELPDTTEAKRLAMEIACDAFGHHASADSFAEYPDGLVAARCIRCQRRLTMDRVPGGLPYLRIKRLVAAILDGDSQFYNLLTFSDLEQRAREEREKLDEVDSLLALAREMINAH